MSLKNILVYLICVFYHNNLNSGGMFDWLIKKRCTSEVIHEDRHSKSQPITYDQTTSFDAIPSEIDFLISQYLPFNHYETYDEFCQRLTTHVTSYFKDDHVNFVPDYIKPYINYKELNERETPAEIFCRSIIGKDIVTKAKNIVCWAISSDKSHFAYVTYRLYPYIYPTVEFQLSVINIKTQEVTVYKLSTFNKVYGTVPSSVSRIKNIAIHTNGHCVLIRTRNDSFNTLQNNIVSKIYYIDLLNGEGAFSNIDANSIPLDNDLPFLSPSLILNDYQTTHFKSFDFNKMGTRFGIVLDNGLSQEIFLQLLPELSEEQAKEIEHSALEQRTLTNYFKENAVCKKLK